MKKDFEKIVLNIEKNILAEDNKLLEQVTNNKCEQLSDDFVIDLPESIAKLNRTSQISKLKKIYNDSDDFLMDLQETVTNMIIKNKIGVSNSKKSYFMPNNFLVNLIESVA